MNFILLLYFTYDFEKVDSILFGENALLLGQERRLKNVIPSFEIKKWSLCAIAIYLRFRRMPWFYRLIHVYLCNINDYRFTLFKKIYLDYNPIIWRFFDFGPSWHQITKFKVFSSSVIWENFGLPLPYHRYFGLPTCHIIDFVRSTFMKVQNQKSSNSRVEI